MTRKKNHFSFISFRLETTQLEKKKDVVSLDKNDSKEKKKSPP